MSNALMEVREDSEARVEPRCSTEVRHDFEAWHPHSATRERKTPISKINFRN